MLFSHFVFRILYLINIWITIYGTNHIPIQSKRDALLYLNQFGYNPCNDSHGILCSISMSTMLKEFQKRFHLKSTGLLDNATIAQMNRPRCGNKDPALTSSKNKTLASLILKWSRTTLTWSLRNYSPRISLADTQTIIQRAFNAWFQHIPLTIRQVCQTCPANFIIDFNQWDHGDGYPFDGPGRTLAHAFFPQDGRIHFDVDELWTTKQDEYKINFYLVAVHEIGHALGLDHIYRKDSIMYPNYQSMKEKDVLPYVDKIQIQNMYGRSLISSTSTTTKKPTTRTTKTTRTSSRLTTRSTTQLSSTIAPSSHAISCRLFIDAAFDFPDSSFHVLDTGLFRRYLPDKRQWDSKVVSSQEIYSRLPSRISAGAYDFSRDEVLIFTSARVYRYKIQMNTHRIIYRQDDSLPIYLQSTIVGAIFYQDNVHIVKANTLQSLDVSNLHKKSSERKLSVEFSGLTGSIKAAFTHGYLHHFFTTDRLVYVWDEQFNRWKTFAKPMENHWFLCH